VVERGDLLMVFNFHPTNSYTNYLVGARNPTAYKARARAPGLAAEADSCGLEAGAGH
jgi:hypothetical protein